jgi:hypothetical protein
MDSDFLVLSRTFLLPCATLAFRKRALSRFRAMPSHVLAVLREFVGASICDKLRVSRTVGNPLFDNRRAARCPTHELRVKRFILGPE